jgi:hypothetical protein
MLWSAITRLNNAKHCYGIALLCSAPLHLTAALRC